MAYRDAEPNPERERRDAARARLAALAAQGASEEQQRRDRERESQSCARRAEQRAEYVHLREAVLQDSPVFFAWLLGAVLLGGGCGTLLFTYSSNTSLKVVGAVFGALSVAAACVCRYPLGRRLVRKELQWLRALPFEAASYETVLRASPSSSCAVKVSVRLAREEELLDEKTLQGLFARVEVEHLERDGATLHASSRSLNCSGGDGPDTNASLRRWMRRLIGEVVLPLHEAYRVVELRFTRD